MSDNTLLDKLQKEFSCDACGFCCQYGGQIEISKSELEAIGEFLECPITARQLIPVHEIAGKPGVYALDLTSPCFFWDKAKRTCMIHLVRPRACRDYPWKLFKRGGCNLVDVVCCHVAQDQLKQLFNSEVKG